METLRRRAHLIEAMRTFFRRRGVLEVETPALAGATATDPHIRSLEVEAASGEGRRRLFLQTSPEHAMKRLVAAGSGPIFQIARAFRAGERGRLHHPEFTLLEWYRPACDHHALMDEVEALLGGLLGESTARRMTYRDAFLAGAGLDPFYADLPTLRDRVRALGMTSAGAAEMDRDACLDLVLSREVQPSLGDGRVFLYDYPASQAALARVRPGDRPGDPSVAERFELFIDGVEIANGYHELTDAAEQRRRFVADGERRRVLGAPAVPPDEHLLAALVHGMPACAGVALGVDRLVMIATGAQTIDEVIAFPVERA